MARELTLVIALKLLALTALWYWCVRPHVVHVTPQNLQTQLIGTR